MKELEERIYNLWIEETNDYAFSRRLSQEIKDIAIDFHNFKAKQAHYVFARESRTDKELFDYFIKERYKP